MIEGPHASNENIPHLSKAFAARLAEMGEVTSAGRVFLKGRDLWIQYQNQDRKAGQTESDQEAARILCDKLARACTEAELAREDAEADRINLAYRTRAINADAHLKTVFTDFYERFPGIFI